MSDRDENGNRIVGSMSEEETKPFFDALWHALYRQFSRAYHSYGEGTPERSAVHKFSSKLLHRLDLRELALAVKRGENVDRWDGTAKDSEASNE